jgi:AAA family ATP:ADP antiporter
VLFMGASFFVIAILCQRILIRIWRNSDWAGTGKRAEERPIGGNPFAGFTLVLRSPYLLGIALFVILLASVNTFLYLQQLRIVADTFPDVETRTQVFSRIDYTVQSLTVMLQLLFTGRLAMRFGVGVLLTAVPVVMVLGLLLLAGFHTFGVLAAVMIARRVGEYAFVRPGREMLFSRVDTETKYKAKSTIDVPVYRGGDALSSQVETGLVSGGMALTTVAMIGAAVAAAWAVVGFMLGRARREAEEEAPPPPAPVHAGNR